MIPAYEAMDKFRRESRGGPVLLGDYSESIPLSVVIDAETRFMRRDKLEPDNGLHGRSAPHYSSPGSNHVRIDALAGDGPI